MHRYDHNEVQQNAPRRNGPSRHPTPYETQHHVPNHVPNHVPPSHQSQHHIPPYPTGPHPYPLYMNNNYRDRSSDSLSQKLVQRDESLKKLENSSTNLSHQSFESIPKAPALPPKIPLEYDRNNSIQSSYSLHSGSTSSSINQPEPESIFPVESPTKSMETPDDLPPPYEALTFDKTPVVSDKKISIPKINKELDSLSLELQRLSTDTEETASRSTAASPPKPPPHQVKVDEEQEPSVNVNKPEAPVNRQVPSTQKTSSEVQDEPITIENFNRVKDLAIADYSRGQFTSETQFDWIKTLLRYACDAKFLEIYNINGEKLARRLSSNDIRKNEHIFVKQAIKLLKKTCSINKYPEAQFTLGCLYSNSPNIKIPKPNILEKNYSKSFDYYSKAAAAGHKDALYRLGVSYEIGVGTNKDDIRAFECFQKSAELGCVASMFKLGIIYIKSGLNVGRSPRRAMYWLTRAAELADEENPHSLYELGKIQEYDFAFLKSSSTLTQADGDFLKELERIGIVRDESKSFEYYSRAAKLKYAPAQCKLGVCYEYGKLGCIIDAKKSIGWYSRAAKQGNCIAEMGLSGWYLTGAKGVLPQNDTEALLWARKSAESGYDKAEYALGYYYEVGLGCEKNLDESRRFYQKAATKGHEKAISKLRDMIR